MNKTVHVIDTPCSGGELAMKKEPPSTAAPGEHEIRIKRVYDPPEPSDGRRILVDRLWPRGLKKEDARLDDWLKELAPSDDLRKWFSHDPGKWDEFRKRYEAELKQNEEAVQRLLALVREGPVTLLFGAADREHNNAVVLKEYLERLLRKGQGRSKSK